MKPDTICQNFVRQIFPDPHSSKFSTVKILGVRYVGNVPYVMESAI